jgi:hypothetical protein
MLQKSIKDTDALSENAQARECLLVILQPQLVLAKIRPWPLAGFTCEGKQYRDAGFGEWTEFYDWLRDSDSNVLGVRYWLGSETEFLSDYARELPYIQIDPSRNLEIYFSERRGVNQARSADQDFLYDAIFRSDDGQYAIGFGIEGLNEADLIGLQNTGARWGEAHRTD